MGSAPYLLLRPLSTPALPEPSDRPGWQKRNLGLLSGRQSHCKRSAGLEVPRLIGLSSSIGTSSQMSRSHSSRERYLVRTGAATWPLFAAFPLSTVPASCRVSSQVNGFARRYRLGMARGSQPGMRMIVRVTGTGVLLLPPAVCSTLREV